jgi:phospholipid/cholesterol/gamma-HCH transport system substrate-binding protein
METRANYILIGAFSVLSLIMAAIFTVWIANAGLDKSYSVYDVKFQGPVRGLELGGEVRFNGIKVGDVTNLSLDKSDPRLVVARVRLLSDTPVKADSIAQLEPAGLTGLAYIQVLAGSEGAGPLLRAKNEERPVIQTRHGELDRFLQSGQGVVDTSIETLNRMKALLTDQNLRNFALTLDNTRKATDLITARGQLLDRTNEAAQNINLAGAEVAKLAQTLNQISKTSGDNLNKTATTYTQLGQNLINDTNEIKTKTNDMLQDGQYLIKDLRNLTANTGDSVNMAKNSIRQIDETNRELRATTIEIRNAATTFNTAAGSVDDFFRQGNNETLPDLSLAAKQITKAGEDVEKLVQDINTSPTGLLSKPQNKKVRWK